MLATAHAATTVRARRVSATAITRGCSCAAVGELAAALTTLHESTPSLARPSAMHSDTLDARTLSTALSRVGLAHGRAGVLHSCRSLVDSVIGAVGPGCTPRSRVTLTSTRPGGEGATSAGAASHARCRDRGLLRAPVAAALACPATATTLLLLVVYD